MMMMLMMMMMMMVVVSRTCPMVCRNPWSTPRLCHDTSATWCCTTPSRNTTNFSVHCQHTYTQTHLDTHLHRQTDRQRVTSSPNKLLSRSASCQISLTLFGRLSLLHPPRRTFQSEVGLCVISSFCLSFCDQHYCKSNQPISLKLYATKFDRREHRAAGRGTRSVVPATTR